MAADYVRLKEVNPSVFSSRYPNVTMRFEQLPVATEVDDFEQLLPWKVDRTQILYRALGDVP